MGHQEGCRTPLPSRILRIFGPSPPSPPPPPRKCLMANIYTTKMSGFGTHLFAQFLRLAAYPLQRLDGGMMLLGVNLRGCRKA